MRTRTASGLFLRTMGVLVSLLALLWRSVPLEAEPLQTIQSGAHEVEHLHGDEQLISSVLETANATDVTSPYPNCRFGVASSSSITDYDIAPLNLGWYVNWTSMASPPRPGGMDYVPTIRVGSNRLPDAVIVDHVRNNPGATWLIGNEPDRPHIQDSVVPEKYATSYHDLYTLIKDADPTAQVMAGGIVQPTPIRLQYLDLVLDAYRAHYGESLPTDGWHIHNFILREATCEAFPDSCWGADVPPGIDATHGELHEFHETDRMDIFTARIQAFREWMHARGYRNVPLFVTEYGFVAPYYDPDGLYYDPDGFPLDEERASRFMQATFDYFLSAEDPDLGPPSDEHRLVQRWAWYSIDDIRFGGALFDPDQPSSPMMLASDFAAYTSAIGPEVDLVAVRAERHGAVPLSASAYQTVTLRSWISNAGNVRVTEPVTVSLVDAQGNLVDSQLITGELRGCAGLVPVTFEWSVPVSTFVTARVVVDRENVITEVDETNNETTITVFLGQKRLYLPVLER